MQNANIRTTGTPSYFCQKHFQKMREFTRALLRIILIELCAHVKLLSKVKSLPIRLIGNN